MANLEQLDPILSFAQGLRDSLLQRDQSAKFERDLWRQLACTSLFRVNLPRSYGGQEKGLPSLVNAFKTLGAESLDIPFCISAIAQTIAIDLLVCFGTAEQKERYVEGLASGDKIAAICNSESGAGTDITAIKSSLSRLTESSYVAKIEKRGATNLSDADLLFCSLWRSDSATAPPTLEVVLVERAQVAQENFVALLAGFRTGSTGSARGGFTTASAEACLLGGTSAGFALLKHCFNMERLLISAVVTGILETVAKEATATAQSRTSMGKPLIEHQFIQEKLFQIHSAHLKMSALVSRVLHNSYPCTSSSLATSTQELAVLKVSTVEDAGTALHAFYELLGFVAYTSNHAAQKLLRDHLALHFLGGTRDQQKILMVKELNQSRKAG